MTSAILLYLVGVGIEHASEDFDTIINLITTYEEKQGKVSRQDMAFRH